MSETAPDQADCGERFHGGKPGQNALELDGAGSPAKEHDDAVAGRQCGGLMGNPVQGRAPEGDAPVLLRSRAVPVWRPA